MREAVNQELVIPERVLWTPAGRSELRKTNPTESMRAIFCLHLGRKCRNKTYSTIFTGDISETDRQQVLPLQKSQLRKITANAQCQNSTRCRKTKLFFCTRCSLPQWCKKSPFLGTATCVWVRNKTPAKTTLWKEKKTLPACWPLK